MADTNHAYYTGRNSIEDNGTVYETLADFPHYTAEERVAFLQGVRDIRGELRLNADTEWEEAA